MLPGLRQRILSRVYGDGLGAMIAAAATERALVHLRHAVHKPPEIIDVSKLVPGESYLVVTRPAPRRKERKLARRAAAARKDLEQATRPSRSTLRLERQLVRAARRADSASPGTRRHRRAILEVERGERQLERRLRPTPKALRLQAEASAAAARLERQREAALAKARKKVRRPRTRVWR